MFENLNYNWKSNLVKLICTSSNSESPEAFVIKLVRSLYKKILTFSFPADIESIGTLLDVKKFIYRELSDTEDSVLLPFVNGYAIEINKNNSLLRQRFSCCHEFAHILIEKYLSKINLDNYQAYLDSNCDYYEEELLCQKIAAEILAPHDIFNDRARSLRPSIVGINNLSQDFGASFTAIIRKLIETKIWNFGFMYWSIKEDVFTNITNKWIGQGFFPKQILNEMQNSLFIIHTNRTRKLLRERYYKYLIEHVSIANNKVLSFIWLN